MRIRSTLLLLVGLIVLDLGRPGSAAGQVLDPIQYTLGSGANLEYGCLGACACPVIFSGPMKGTFTFYRTGVDPLFTHYALLNIDWTYTLNDGPGGTPRVAHVRGNGTYDVGGEVALTQRLKLDVTTDDTLPQHFDSGVVPVRAAFPIIDVEARVSASACYDSAFHVVASPFGVAGVPPGGGGRLLSRLTPNPSHGDVELLFAARSAGAARVDVLDVRGRVVATLLDRPLDAGQYLLRWDGHDAHGGDAAPGIYWVRGVADGHSDRERIVRLK